MRYIDFPLTEQFRTHIIIVITVAVDHGDTIANDNETFGLFTLEKVFLFIESDDGVENDEKLEMLMLLLYRKEDLDTLISLTMSA